ncbi:Uncharacterised protein [Bifidobacterium dentium]|uniref:Uncharacterized protein n=1 Tax=Bifidobacterium dentium (strain ATCC 27534 / DSM 20436 / JCM 1195 / Bd1) TaxID=401473 RepID=D2Q8X9_BIFDB|nr:hypothetical protein BDP_0598 [Bifidobacterium dentium Bd1]BAQ26564.1 hypothetical protein BBDE_0570 [Bifidobacterium dentium JCM 1195 = DSM 20436]SEB74088.1 hypothetical protein SAMN05192536_0702 [Bifidobacterium dentium JCM 1195 = DSM 20436]VEG23233.1 Uncharacterised protein [Bifidobacterium dentium]
MTMTFDVLIALITTGGVIVGALLGFAGTSVRNRLDAYRIAQDMQQDNQKLWQWNRQLVDHIYKNLGPPPPRPPDDLFKHDND